MKKIGILGSTGSIGTQTLQVINLFKQDFEIIYLTANNNVELLIKQSLQYKPKYVCIVNESKVKQLTEKLSNLNCKIISGREGLLEIASCNEIDICVNALVGSSGMEPTVNSLKAGIDVALSNKESMVMAGEYINKLKYKNNCSIYPVDSEHSAIWQCLRGEDFQEIRKLILTGSGGPFLKRDLKSFEDITISEALNHPNWTMGKKITIDSATMMNKGLEVIEAKWLFEISPEKIDIIVHPQSIIHSMVEFIDGSIKAQLGTPNMKIPIQYALTYPKHFKSDWEELNLAKIGSLTFEKPNTKKFKCIELAYYAMNAGNSFSVVLNVANDNTVDAFLNQKIKFNDIAKLNELAMEKHPVSAVNDLETIEELTIWTENFIKERV
ncbi:MAG: 1-deoxy-D-xylulose-5-phosphate reductoisomerase [Candidatus Neomarinimicrobiota bacterium]|jgi:1-deoxy-D-xylulose-5-phosphate reductoisomerase|nr:1-deoxy-D-xylulose-5-phosphate reductoisomerase [Candidatus Neomarinimicrobiota bacterium]